jgi:hypothetical protein
VPTSGNGQHRAGSGTKLVGGELGHHLALEHGDGVDGGLLGQSWFLSFSRCLVMTHRVARFFDSAARASAIISFLPLARTVGAATMD